MSKYKSKKKVVLASLAGDYTSARYKRSKAARLQAVEEQSKYKKKKPFPSSNKSKILKEWRDGWFGKE
jgi:hypothetical protein|tara:strand:+ start:4915 stop:5118 length:204 start_codon:yes stop_codon:yes gene_type:complete